MGELSKAALDAAVSSVIDYVVDGMELTAADAGRCLSLALARCMRSAVASRRMTETHVILLLDSIRMIALDSPVSGLANDNDIIA
jgi:hypothetical protein